MTEGIWIKRGEGDVHIHAGKCDGIPNGVILGVNPTLKNLKFSSPCVGIDYEKETVTLQWANAAGEPVSAEIDKDKFGKRLVAFLESLVPLT